MSRSWLLVALFSVSAFAVMVPASALAAKKLRKKPQSSASPAVTPAVPIDPVQRLAAEVRTRGWIAYSAQERGSWDLFVMRPDGTERRNITRTLDINEGGVRFSPDGRKLLFYRMPKGTIVDNNRYGTYDLVVANADGTDPLSLGGACQWASWAPDGKQLSCLSNEGVAFFDLSTKKALRRVDRHGVVEQLVGSPDGNWLCGTANGLGEHWNIARLNAATGAINRVSDGNCFNCTPDWLPDGKSVLFSRGHPCTDGFAQLWLADADGKSQRLIYGETGRHIYGGGASPDGKYLIFTRSRVDLGKVDHSETTMGLMRLVDAPIVGGNSEVLRKKFPLAKAGPTLDLSAGWEPDWTFAEITKFGTDDNGKGPLPGFL